MTNNECIEIHLDAKTKQLAERAAATLGYATLTEFFQKNPSQNYFHF